MKELKTSYLIGMSFIALVLILIVGTYTGFFEKDNNYLTKDLCKKLIPEISGSKLIITDIESDEIVNNAAVQQLTCKFGYTGEEYTRYPLKKVSGVLTAYVNVEDETLFNYNFGLYLGDKIVNQGTVETIYYDHVSNSGRSRLYLIYPGYYRPLILLSSGVSSSAKPGNDKEGEILWQSSNFYKSILLKTPKEVKDIRYIIKINLEGDISDYRFLNFVLQNYFNFYEPAKEKFLTEEYRVMTFPYN